jgi:hypothetical protein
LPPKGFEPLRPVKGQRILRLLALSHKGDAAKSLTSLATFHGSAGGSRGNK